MNDSIPLYLIYCKTRTLLSKKNYKDWREIQDTLDDYMTSLGPWTVVEITDFFRDDFQEESRWPFSQRQIEAFLNSDSEAISAELL